MGSELRGLSPDIASWLHDFKALLMQEDCGVLASSCVWGVAFSTCGSCRVSV